MRTHYTCIYTIYTPLTTSIHPKYTLNTPLHGRYWAVSCFNYGDDAVFNRQRYGPAWIITSHDNGVTWNETATKTDMFTGRLAAPRFIQYGKDYEGAPSAWVYVPVYVS